MLPTPAQVVTTLATPVSAPELASSSLASTKEAVEKPDVLDKSVTFLAKRDGIDKVLKIMRYTVKFLLASALKESKSDFTQRLKAFESSVGTSRKAYRLGKWLADVNKLRKAPLTGHQGALEVLAYGGECVYYFVEQLTWLVKAGLLDKRHARRFQIISAYAEMLGYVGSVALTCLALSTLKEREAALEANLLRRKKEGEQGPDGDAFLQCELEKLRSKRLTNTLAAIQDLADALLALNDIQGATGILDT